MMSFLLFYRSFVFVVGARRPVDISQDIAVEGLVVFLDHLDGGRAGFDVDHVFLDASPDQGDEEESRALFHASDRSRIVTTCQPKATERRGIPIVDSDAGSTRARRSDGLIPQYSTPARWRQRPARSDLSGRTGERAREAPDRREAHRMQRIDHHAGLGRAVGLAMALP